MLFFWMSRGGLCKMLAVLKRFLSNTVWTILYDTIVWRQHHMALKRGTEYCLSDLMNINVNTL